MNRDTFFDDLDLSEEFDDDDELSTIPLLTSDEEQQMRVASLPETLPILALRNTVLFPGVVLPITVGRDASLKLVKDAYAGDRLIGMISQRDADIENPEVEDLFDAGTAASILKLIKMPDGSVSIVIQAKRRFKLGEITQTEPYMKAEVEAIEEEIEDPSNVEVAARVRSIKDMAERRLASLRQPQGAQ